MKRVTSLLLLIIGLTFSTQTAFGQTTSKSLEHWHTAGVGLSTPLGFNAGASYSLVLKGPVFVQVQASASKDVYVTKHSVYAAGAAVGLRYYTELAMAAVSLGPSYISGTRGADLLAPFAGYESMAMTATLQVLFRETRMGFELYSNVNPVRNVSGLRLIYRLGSLR